MPAKVRLLDRAGETVCWLDPDQAQQMIADKVAEPLGTRRKVHVIRYCGEEPILEKTRFRLRSPGAGCSHSRETYQNPRGVWTIDHIPASTRGIFLTVVDECLTPAA